MKAFAKNLGGISYININEENTLVFQVLGEGKNLTSAGDLFQIVKLPLL